MRPLLCNSAYNIRFWDNLLVQRTVSMLLPTIFAISRQRPVNNNQKESEDYDYDKQAIQLSLHSQYTPSYWLVYGAFRASSVRSYDLELLALKCK